MPHAVLCVGSNTEGYDDIPAWRDQWTGGGVRRPGRIAVERDVWAGCDLCEPVLAHRSFRFFSGRSAGRDVTRPGPAIGLADPGLAALFPFQGRLAQPRGYLTVTVAPAPSRAAFALSALSLLTFSSTVLGAPSTRSLASLRPRLVRLRTSLMTWIFLSPAASRMTSNSSCSSASSAAAAPPWPPAAGTATAAGAAALTSNVSSDCFTKSESSSRVISLNASRRSSVLIFAIVMFLVLSLRVVWSSGQASSADGVS